jgi:hypothetical protein
MFDRFAVHQPPHNTQEDIMFTRIPAQDLICAPRPGRPPPARVGSPQP